MYSAYLVIATALAIFGAYGVKSIAVTPSEYGLRSNSMLRVVPILAMISSLSLGVFLGYDAVRSVAGVRIVADNSSLDTHRWPMQTVYLDPLVKTMWDHCSICRSGSSLQSGNQIDAGALHEALRAELVTIMAEGKLYGPAEMLQTGSIPHWFRDAVEPSLAVALSQREPVKQVLAATFGGENSEAWKPAVIFLRNKGIQVRVTDLSSATAGGIRLEAIFGGRSDSKIHAWALISGEGTTLQLSMFRASTTNSLTKLSDCLVPVPSGTGSIVRVLSPALLSCTIPQNVGNNESLWIGDPAGATVTRINHAGSLPAYQVETDLTWSRILDHFSTSGYVSLATDLADSNRTILRSRKEPPDSRTLHLRFENGIVGLAATQTALESALSRANTMNSTSSDIVTVDNCASPANGLSWAGIYPRSTLSGLDSQSIKVLTNSGVAVGGVSTNAALYALPDQYAEPSALVAAIRCLSTVAPELIGLDPPDSDLVTVTVSTPPILLWGDRENDEVTSRSDIKRLVAVVVIFIGMVIPAFVFGRDTSVERTK
jgi:hypothetical protein